MAIYNSTYSGQQIDAGIGLANTAYQKAASGIPKTDLASDVQLSLGKADTALQEHQSLSAYRTSAAQDVIDNGKLDKTSSSSGTTTNVALTADGESLFLASSSTSDDTSRVYASASGSGISTFTDTISANIATFDEGGNLGAGITYSNDTTDVSNAVMVTESGITMNGTVSGTNNIEKTGNKVTSISSSSTDTQYPSAKCVYDNLATKSSVSVSSTGSATDEIQYITIDGTEKKIAGGTYTLPTASASTLGGIKVGTGLSIDANGVLSVSYSAAENAQGGLTVTIA